MFGDWKIILQSSKQKQIGNVVQSLLDLQIICKGKKIMFQVCTSEEKPTLKPIFPWHLQKPKTQVSGTQSVTINVTMK